MMQKTRSWMPSWLSGCFISFSLYSRIPVPQVPWTEEAMGWAIGFFPLVGVILGAVMAAFFRLAFLAGLGDLARTCLGTALPLLVTGGIHMDGFLDTVDARCSFQPRDKKLEILKDPHTGAFAIIGGGVYLLLYAAAFSELGSLAFPAAAGVFVVSRSLSGWSVVSFPKAKKDGLAHDLSGQGKQGAVKVLLTLWGLLAAAFLIGKAGAVAGGFSLAAALGVFGIYHRMAMKEFGGVTGDLAGYFLQLCELGMLAVLAVFL